MMNDTRQPADNADQSDDNPYHAADQSPTEDLSHADASAENFGPWAILLCSIAGGIGALLYWLVGVGSESGYVISFSTFAGLMYAALWASQRQDNS